MKKKYTIGEIILTKKIGTLGKHSTADDLIKLLGEPNTLTLNNYKYSNYFMIYGNLGIYISGVKKRILAILISNNDASSRRRLRFGRDNVLKDWDKFSKLDSQGIKEYLSKYNIGSDEIVSVEDLSTYIIPIRTNKEAKFNHRFYILYDLYDRKFNEILIEYNYRAKDRDN